jgi:hypothetical protein
MNVRQHLQSLAVLTPVLRAPGVSSFSIVSILIVDVSGGGQIGSPAQAAGGNAEGDARGTDTHARRCL